MLLYELGSACYLLSQSNVDRMVPSLGTPGESVEVELFVKLGQATHRLDTL